MCKKGPGKKWLILLISVLFLNHGTVWSQDLQKVNKKITEKLKKWENPLSQWKHVGKLKIDSVKVQKGPDKINLFFSQTLSYYPIREDNSAILEASLKKSLGRTYKNYDLEIFTNGYTLAQLIPNIYRSSVPVDNSRIHPFIESKPVLIEKPDAFRPSKGLYGESVALWHSHGYFFEMTLDRWEFQRARLFGTVEDISVMGYVLPYLSKMLENAGANVFLPRERDTQINEVIVDNDKSTDGSEVVLHVHGNVETGAPGFLLTDTIFSGFNPFKSGSSLRITGDSALYIADIPADGDYAVYVSYPLQPDNSRSVKYSVNHSGGRTNFLVNQTIGGGTWIYLGTFYFRKGKNPGLGSVSISHGDANGGYIGLDAIKFGGGMGNVARRPSADLLKNQRSVNENAVEKVTASSTLKPDFTWKISGKPRFVEGSRYWLQYAGMPDTLVFSPNAYKNDYNDDYQSRGLWVNYLSGKPFSKGENNTQPGLGIPIDLSIAFHTDAGVTPNDSIIGSLAIYSTGADNAKFPDGTSRMASRDLSDIVQTQVVHDIQLLYNPVWTRRGLWDKSYAEARRPNVPALLFELLSHQNKADQQFGLDPRFRSDVSRAIYKGILRYLSYTEKRHFVVMPVPVKGFGITPVNGKKVRLSWIPVTDSLEPTSKPDRFKIYRRVGENGFDNGFIVNQPSAEIELESYDKIYSFRITAINDGGESFPSEVLSVGMKEDNKPAFLVVNGFNRICGPAWFDRDNMAGVAWWNDRGVPDHYEISNVGDQYDFERKSPWLDDDAPGWGASNADMEGKVIPGNTFDFPYIHGKAIMAAGHSFFSVSDEYFCSDDFNQASFSNFDILFGEEKATPSFIDSNRVDFKIYTPELMTRIEELTKNGANIFMSGAYIGSDLLPAGDSSALKFASKYLHFFPRTGHAVNRGLAYATDYAKPAFTGNLKFNTEYSESIYQVESPDAIEPSGKDAIIAFRYTQNNTSAGVLYNGSYKTLILGFPFETILSEEERNSLMKQIINYFEKR